jgi:hypothetical protein
MDVQIVILSGIDGSGKSAIVNQLCKTLKNRGYKVCTPWLRYNHYLTKIILLYARLAGLTRYEYSEGQRIVGYHEFYRSKIVSWIFVLFTFIDTLFASIFKVYIPAWFCGRKIICDRWIPDILIDIAIDTGQPDIMYGTWAKFFWGLIPAKSRCIIVHRQLKDLLECRRENNLDITFKKRLEMYTNFANSNRIPMVKNHSTLSDVVSKVNELVTSH